MSYEDNLKQALIEHKMLVRRLAKPGKDVLETMTAAKADLMHACMGICGEAGELLDSIKKHVIYNKSLDFDNIVEELGDLEFYMEQLRQHLIISRSQVLFANIEKLNKRYGLGSYSDQQAQTRADKS